MASVSIDRLTVLPGDVLNVSYSGFPTALSNTIHFFTDVRPDIILKDLTYNGGGSGTTNITIPSNYPPGQYILIGQDDQGNFGASQTFTVVDVNQALGGNIITVSPAANGPALTTGQQFPAVIEGEAKNTNPIAGQFRLRAVYNNQTATSVSKTLAPGARDLFQTTTQFVADPAATSIQFFFEQTDPNGNALRVVAQATQTGLTINTPAPSGRIDPQQSSIPTNALSGQQFQCHVAVQNTGSIAGSFRLTPYINDAPSGPSLGSFSLNAQQEQVQVINMTLSQTATVSFLLEVFLPSRSVWTIADLWPNPSQVVTVGAASPHAHIASFSANVTGNPGQQLTEAPVIENDGNIAGSIRASLRTSVNATPIGSTSPQTLQPGGAATFTMGFVLPSAPGQYPYVMTAEHQDGSGNWVVDDSRAFTITVNGANPPPPPPSGSLLTVSPTKTTYASGEQIVLNCSYTVNGSGVAGNYTAGLVTPPNNTLDSQSGSFPSTGQFQVVFAAQTFAANTGVIATVAVGNTSKSVSLTIQGQINPPPPSGGATLDVNPTKTVYKPSEPVTANCVYKLNNVGKSVSWTASLALGGTAPLQNKTGTSAADGTFQVVFDPLTSVNSDTSAVIKVVAGGVTTTKDVTIAPSGGSIIPGLSNDMFWIVAAVVGGGTLLWYQFAGGKGTVTHLTKATKSGKVSRI